MTDYVSNQRTFFDGLVEYTEFGGNGVLQWSRVFVFLGERLLSTIVPAGSAGELTEYDHPDRLGTRLVTNQQTGSNYEQIALPFGTALNAESGGSTSRRFTSYERSERTGLDYAQNRTYDAKQGRFTQVDPIGMQAVNLGNPQTLNLYNYVGNDPINRTDPDGLFWGFFKKLFKKILKVLAFVALVAAVALLTYFGVSHLFIGGIWHIFAGIGILFANSFFLAKMVVTIASKVKEWLHRCNVPDFNELSKSRQDELGQRGVSPEQWDRLKNKQRLGYFNIVAAIAAAGLSLFGWLVDWAAGGIRQDRTYFIQGPGATNLLEQVRASSSFDDSNGHRGYPEGFRFNSLTRSLQTSFSTDGTKLDADIDAFNPERKPFGFGGHAYEYASHFLGRIFGGRRSNPYNLAFRSSWECR